jgi:hypothetical protein
MSLWIISNVPEPAIPNSVDSNARTDAVQTEALRVRLESLRNQHFWVTLSFTGLYQSFAVHHSATALRLGDCSYDVDADMSGLIDILLAAKIAVGYPAGWENYQPESRFGIYIGVDSPDGIDLWFSNPLRFASRDLTVIGESHDRGKAIAYKIRAAPTLRNELWDWVREHGNPRQDTLAACRDIEKYDSRRLAPKQ